MSERQGHTPGPWHVERHTDYDKDIIIIEPRCMIDNDDVDQAEAEANARLIAAAPDLLESLVLLVNASHAEAAEEWERLHDLARTAIAKATGRT